MHLSDRVTGGVLAVLGGLSIWGASRLPGVPGQDVGPAAFPTLIGAGLLICGIAIALGIGHSFEVPEEAVPEEPDSRGYLPVVPAGWRALVPPAMLLFYMLAVDVLGFLVTAAVVVLAAALALGARPKLAIPLALLAPPAVHLVFYKLLRVPLPDGFLAAPWS